MDVLYVIAFKPQNTAYGDTFRICVRHGNVCKSYYSSKHFPNYSSKIIQDGKNTAKHINVITCKGNMFQYV